MEIVHGDIEPHRKYLANIAPDVRARRLRHYRLESATLEILPFICLSDIVTSKFPKWRRYMHPLDPISLDDLKNWFGIPNDAAEAL